MTTRRLAPPLACVALLLSVTGCADETAQSRGGSPEPSGVTIDVSIAEGEVRPSGKEVMVKVGEPVRLRVDSDAADELHVHAEPDHEFEVKPADGQTFEFTVDVPGQAAVESHHLEKTIVELVVTP